MKTDRWLRHLQLIAGVGQTGWESMVRSVVAASLFLASMSISCKGESVGLLSSGESESLRKYRQAIETGPEAAEWVRRPDTILAGNRFETKAEAIAWVNEAYKAGATHIAIDPESIANYGDGSSSALVLSLPEDAGKRAAVLELCRREVARDGMTLGPETRHGFVSMWWD